MEKMDIGKRICQQLTDEGRTKAWLARRTGMDPSAFGKMLAHNSMDTEKLLKISYHLNHDYFADYSAYLTEYKQDIEEKAKMA